MISLFRGTHAAEENESFCYIYHSVLIEEMCLCPHLRRKKRNTSKIFFRVNFVRRKKKRLGGSNLERDISVRACQRGNCLNGGCCEDVCDRPGQQDRLWCSWNTALSPSTVKMTNGWKFLWVTLNRQWQYIREDFFFLSACRKGLNWVMLHNKNCICSLAHIKYTAWMI